MKHKTILDIGITFSKTCWTCLHDVFGSKTHSTSSLTIIYSHFFISWCQLPAGKTDTNISCNLHENATSVGYLTQLLLLNPEKRKAYISQHCNQQNYWTSFTVMNLKGPIFHKFHKFLRNSQDFVPWRFWFNWPWNLFTLYLED